jgi:pyruvate/2-oxoglutarate dehydrogenase complex dihydrolipoamide acyltransferase (E2) component
MKALLLFSAGAGLLLNSATPPASTERMPLKDEAARDFPRLIYEPEEIPPAIAQIVPVSPAPEEAEAPEPLASAQPAPLQSSPGAGVKVVVSLPQQKAYVFEDGSLVATSPVSTGKKGHETPVGTFRILQKKVHHRSNRYSNAPMPYMQRLTWQGVALHAGSLPGYPASHGCIRLPRSFAKKLYNLTDFSTSVTVTHQRPKSPEEAIDLS